MRLIAAVISQAISDRERGNWWHTSSFVDSEWVDMFFYYYGIDEERGRKCLLELLRRKSKR